MHHITYNSPRPRIVGSSRSETMLSAYKVCSGKMSDWCERGVETWRSLVKVLHVGSSGSGSLVQSHSSTHRPTVLTVHDADARKRSMPVESWGEELGMAFGRSLVAFSWRFLFPLYEI
jgi:hypothetical protein